MEEWKDINGYEGYYQVSNQGRVRSLDRVDSLGRLHASAVKSLRRHTSGYWVTDLFKGEGVRKNGGGGRGKTHLVHRLVAIHFIGDPEPGQEVCHLNGDPSDSRVENLVWGTRAENHYDSVAHGTHFSSKKTACTWGHELKGRNLTPSGWGNGVRNCLACSRGRAYARYYGEGPEVREICDLYYESVMSGKKIDPAKRKALASMLR